MAGARVASQGQSEVSMEESVEIADAVDMHVINRVY